MTINDLIKTAKAATAGPWVHIHIFDGEEVICYDDDSKRLAVADIHRNAKHIAQFSPATIIPILEELAAARAYVFGDFPETGTDVILEIAKQRCDKYREARAKTDKALGTQNVPSQAVT